MMLVLHPPFASPNPIVLCRDLGKSLTVSPSPCPLLFPSKLRPSASPKRRCSKNENTHEASFQGFPALASDVPWDGEGVWSTFAFYLLSLHIPLSFGGLSVVAHVLRRPVLDPQTAVNNLILKEILLSSDISRAACVLVFCIITPLLEEIVYRGFLLTSISSTSKWQQAVLLSSAIFSAVHFSGENSLQLFVIGCILGCSYCWSGDLSTSFLIHSLYNALILIITYTS
ncbi:uncharacterized protein LOC115682321 [Syzygium oleosum]|uniref:uncharacterized protein LOC115682321 n=1 Tax=Syzygium oleosum TaxID=219896 RepID=UPI0024BA7FAD|nr:uncharacterized protein LOC115682321 [Syzygium oleosum]